MPVAARCLPFVLAIASLAACGGKTIGQQTVPETPDSGSTPTEPSPTGPNPTRPGQPACVTLPALTAGDLVCGSDSDCTFTSQGTVCSDQCNCGVVAANTAAADRIATDLPTFTMGCGCGTDLQLECIQGVCTGVAPSFDAGPPDFDGGPTPIILDAGPVPVGDASTCVDIDLSAYDTSCTTSADCTSLEGGQICNGECDCFGSPVNVDNTAQWMQATSGVVWGECGCPAEPSPVCVGGQCVAGSTGTGTGSGTGG